MVRDIKTKWEWTADTIDDVVRDSELKDILKETALDIEKNMALSYPFAPTNAHWEKLYPQLEGKDNLIEKFLYVCRSGDETCVACHILTGIDDITFYIDDDVENVFYLKSCDFCRYGKLSGICEEEGSLYQYFQRTLRQIVQEQSDLDICYYDTWFPTFDNEEDDAEREDIDFEPEYFETS